MKKTILIVDDDIDYLFQMKLTVERFGFEVITAESRREGEKVIETLKPDLAIFDLMMESEDSGFVLSYISKKRYPDVPVILATAVTAETGMMFDLGRGNNQSWIKADLILNKGLRADQLEKEIKKLLKI
jgi:two-component system, OmpR family, response regulator